MTAPGQEHNHFGGSERAPITLLTTLHLLSGPPESSTINCTLSYDPNDPYVIRLELLIAEDMRVTWVVGRDLLYAGTEGLSGDGDFKVWPSRGGYHHSTLYLQLKRPNSVATFATNLRAVRHWLQDTYALVPHGTESSLLDWAALAQSLLPPA
jgi:hypothetical protein